MAVLENLTEDESYLVAILQDLSGIDIAEFCWKDERSRDGVFRAYPYQFHWWRCDDKQQIDQGARAVGKSVSIQLRATSFIFNYPGEEMLLTAPEMIHLDPVTKYVEERLTSVRLTHEMLQIQRHANTTGFRHHPFEAQFLNGARIIGRIPQKDGRGVKGQHPTCLEMDEAADYPTPGWVELIETLKYGDARARWRVHGVTRGVRDYFHKLTQSKEWRVHRPVAMNRGDWSEGERRSKIELYGGRDSPDYRRNILGLHGDASSSLFVLSRLMNCVDTDESSTYNKDFYYFTRLTDEWVMESGLGISEMIDPPPTHKKSYGSFWVGSDIGVTLAPTEILVFGEDQDGVLVLVTRVSLQRISAMDQVTAFAKIADFYQPACVALDRTGVGLPIYQMAADRGGHLGQVVRGYNFSEKLQVGVEPVAFAMPGSNLDRRNYDPDLADDPDPDRDEAYPSWDVNTVNERAIMVNVLEHSSDILREVVDARRIRLPYDVELLKEFQGQTYVVSKSTMNPYGRKEFSRGKFHTLDASRMAVLGRKMIELERNAPVIEDEVVPVYFGDF